jgi:hypothetical protein
MPTNASHGRWNATLIADQLGYTQKVHLLVRDHVVEYVIKKKKRKAEMKMFAAALGIAVGATIASMIKKAYKARKGTLGERRNEYVRYLALHFMHSDCRLREGTGVCGRFAANYSAADAP